MASERRRAQWREGSRRYRAKKKLERQRKLEAQLRYNAKWRETHPEEWAEHNRKATKAWRHRNPEKYRAYQRAWRARQKAKAA